MDRSGRTRAEFEEIWPFDGPLARVARDGKMGYIDRSCRVVWKSW